jgi:predicted DNA binding protein
MYDLLANHDSVERATALQWSYAGDELAMLHAVEGDVAAFEAAVRSLSVLVDLDVSRVGETRCYAFVNCETTPPMRQLFESIRRMSAIPVPPVEYHGDGSISFAVVGPSAEIQAAIEAVPAAVSVAVDRIGGTLAGPGTAETRLAPRQREALEAAVDLGYYEIPREASHEDVAAAIDCAPSTAAEHLRKAEATVLESAVGGR